MAAATQNGLGTQTLSPEAARLRPQQRRTPQQSTEPERRPLLQRNTHSQSQYGEYFGCNPSSHTHLPVYTTIHRIRRDVRSIVEDYLTLEQLRDMRLNMQVIRPLVDKLYDLDDISIGSC